MGLITSFSVGLTGAALTTISSPYILTAAVAKTIAPRVFAAVLALSSLLSTVWVA